MKLARHFHVEKISLEYETRWSYFNSGIENAFILVTSTMQLEANDLMLVLQQVHVEAQ